jgi:gluconate transporter
MPLLALAAGIAFLLVLMLLFRWDAFFSLLFACFLVGLLNGLPPGGVLAALQKGIGDTMGSIALIMVLGAMLGKLAEESGAAYTITQALTRLFGVARIQYAVLLTALLVGMPMLYNAGFLVLIPLIYALSVSQRIPLLWIGIPFCATLSVTHGFLPPHPAPTYVVQAYGGSLNLMLLYGLIAVVPAALLGGIAHARWFRGWQIEPPPQLFAAREPEPAALPGLGRSLLVLLAPVLLMLGGALFDMAGGAARWPGLKSGVAFLADPAVALGLSVLLGIALLGLREGRQMSAVMQMLGRSVASIAAILMLIAVGGGFKEILIQSGTAAYIRMQAEGLALHPLLLAWGVAAAIRVAVGSATVATTTAAGILMPVAQSGAVSPELLALATGAGSIMFSHVNDTGFWMFKEYFNLNIRQTLLSWTALESIVGTVGLLTALALDLLGA